MQQQQLLYQSFLLELGLSSYSEGLTQVDRVGHCQPGNRVGQRAKAAVYKYLQRALVSVDDARHAQVQQILTPCFELVIFYGYALVFSASRFSLRLNACSFGFTSVPVYNLHTTTVPARHAAVP